jgi:hypothetical protein
METKRELLMILEQRVIYSGQSSPLMVSLGMLAADLKKAIINNNKSLQWPSKE